MRILALGVALPSTQVDNYNWASALSFYDYDALVIDPNEAVSNLILGVTGGTGAYASYAEEPVLDGPTTDTSLGLSDLLRQRRDEVARHLARGGLIVCFAYPDVAHGQVASYSGCHRLYWLPSPIEKDYGPAYVQRATGSQVKVTDYEHPFADFLESQRSQFLYRATFSEGAQGFGEDARVFGRSAGGAAVALDLSVGGGRVIFLPALQPRSSTDRGALAASLVAAIRNTLLIAAEEEPPDWLESYPLPGIQAAKQQIDLAESQLEPLEVQLAEARREYLGLDRYRRILWQEGKYGFDLPVRDALALIGFRSITSTDDPATFIYEGDTVFVETEAGPGAIGMEPHYRMRERFEQKIAEEARRPYGLVIVNGYRELPPEERSTQFEDSLRVAAESMRYCVVDAAQVFAAVRDQMEGRSENVKAFCRALLSTEGALIADPALSESTERTK